MFSVPFSTFILFIVEHYYNKVCFQFLSQHSYCLLLNTTKIKYFSVNFSTFILFLVEHYYNKVCFQFLSQHLYCLLLNATTIKHAFSSFLNIYIDWPRIPLPLVLIPLDIYLFIVELSPYQNKDHSFVSSIECDFLYNENS